jgi:glycosyltransferase involved in cell wall biosynthesis
MSEEVKHAHGAHVVPSAPLLLHVFHSFGAGGSQTRLVRLIDHFGPRFRHAVVALDNNYSSMSRISARSQVTPFPVAPVHHTFAKWRRYSDVLNRLRPHRLVTHNWGTIEWAIGNATAGMRHIHIEDGFGPDETERQKRRRVAARNMLLRRSAIVVPSTTLVAIAERIWKLPKKRIHYVPNGIDCARFTPYGGERKPDDVLVVGTVAALRSEKRIDRLIRAFAAVRFDQPAKLVIVGDGPERADLETLAAELGLSARVMFVGPQQDTAPFYKSFDVFALSSDTEQMPYTIIEAMASGCAIASTNVGDIQKMVSAENVEFIVPKTENDVAGALGRLASNRALRQRLGSANRDKASLEYDESLMFDAFGELFGVESHAGVA